MGNHHNTEVGCIQPGEQRLESGCQPIEQVSLDTDKRDELETVREWCSDLDMLTGDDSKDLAPYQVINKYSIVQVPVWGVHL